ncbi:MAG TPA: SDR family oxidoreductase [Oleiagrimonas sp.]|nr:SDR family oxidoreductase [Oleiagrimonas sp.]
MNILITGATGQIGGAAAHHLMRAGVRIRALVRDPVRATGLADAEIAIGSFEDGASLDAALDGIDAMLLTGRDSPDAVSLQNRVLEHAERSTVKHVVLLSAIGAQADSPISLMRDHHAVDEILRAGSTIDWTLLQPHLYMQNLLRSAEPVHNEGRLSAPMGNTRIPLVDTRDVGLAAATVLQDPAAHASKTYRLTGPETCSYADVATALSAVVNRTVTYEAVPPEDFEHRLIAAGIPDWRAFDLAHIVSAYTAGDLDPSPDFETLTGQRPTSLTCFVQDHADVFCGSS